MKTITSAEGRPFLVDDEDFDALNAFVWRVDKDGYAYRSFGHGKRMRMHRQIKGLPYKDPRKLDHRNTVKSDNRKENLRFATSRQNAQNIGVIASNTSGMKNVEWLPSRGKWRARISDGKRRVFLGHFDTAEEAHEAFARAAAESHGEFANTGEPK